ncbi:YdcF family protein, partial [Klebsiella pneumoniae]|nr:YdcF family protein [Klebsiella pneumoniae]
HFFYWGKFIYGVNGSGPIEDGFAKAYQTSPNEEKIANSYAAAQIRNKHVKEGIALYQENFKKFGDFDSGYNALVYLRALAKTPEERQQATGKLHQQLQQHFPNQT